MSELLAAGLKGLRQGQGLLQTLLGVAYLQFEGQLKTVAGLEFVRARQVGARVGAGAEAVPSLSLCWEGGFRSQAQNTHGRKTGFVCMSGPTHTAVSKFGVGDKDTDFGG